MAKNVSPSKEFLSTPRQSQLLSNPDNVQYNVEILPPTPSVTPSHAAESSEPPPSRNSTPVGKRTRSRRSLYHTAHGRATPSPFPDLTRRVLQLETTVNS
ncbi:hypothetical protein ACOMHN_042606 [Nucella lapillus]